MTDLTIVLRSGATIRTTVTSHHITKDGAALTGLSLVAADTTPARVLWVDVAEIAAITTEEQP
jgi:hypothetical protein